MLALVTPVLERYSSVSMRFKKARTETQVAPIDSFKVQLVADYLAAVGVANECLDLQNLEIVTPVALGFFGKVLNSSPKPPNRPGRTFAPNYPEYLYRRFFVASGGSSGMESEFVQNVSSRELAVELTEGHVVELHTDAAPKTYAITASGQIGRVLEPLELHPTIYKTSRFLPNEFLSVPYPDRFALRQCEGVWGPSVKAPSKTAPYIVQRLTEELESRFIDSEQTASSQ